MKCYMVYNVDEMFMYGSGGIIYGIFCEKNKALKLIEKLKSEPQEEYHTEYDVEEIEVDKELEKGFRLC